MPWPMADLCNKANNVSSKLHSADSNNDNTSTRCAIHPAPTKSLRSFASNTEAQIKIKRPGFCF